MGIGLIAASGLFVSPWIIAAANFSVAGGPVEYVALSFLLPRYYLIRPWAVFTDPQVAGIGMDDPKPRVRA